MDLDIIQRGLVDRAKEVLDLFKKYPELMKEQFSNVFQKVKEIISYGATEISKLSWSWSYCAALTALLTSFFLAYDNYKRGDMCVRSLRYSKEMVRRVDNLYDCKIKPLLKKIDTELSKCWSTMTLRQKDVDNLKLRLCETKAILDEIENAVTNDHVEKVRQERKNHVCIGGIVVGLGTAAIMTTPLGLGIAGVSAFAYWWGSDNQNMLSEAIANLEASKRKANEAERNLLTCLTMVELE